MTYISRASVFIVALILALCAAMIFVFGIYEIRAKNQKASELVSASEAGIKKATLAQSMRSLRNNASKEVVMLNEVAIGKGDIISFIENIETSGEEVGLRVKIASVTTDETAATDEPRKVVISIETDGAWEPSLRFIHMIEHLPYPIAVDQTSLYRGDALENAPDFSDIGDETASTRAIWRTSTMLTLTIYK